MFHTFVLSKTVILSAYVFRNLNSYDSQPMTPFKSYDSTTMTAYVAAEPNNFDGRTPSMSCIGAAK